MAPTPAGETPGRPWAEASERRGSPVGTLALETLNALWSLVTTAVAVGLGIALVPGIRAENGLYLLLAILGMSLADTIAQPAFRRLAQTGSAVAALVLGFGLQFAILGVGLQLTPGLVSDGWSSVFDLLIVVSVILVITRWLLGRSETEYVVGRVGRPAMRRVRRATQPAVAEADRGRGLLVIQLDGLSPQTLRYAMQAGLTPNISRFIDSGTHVLDEWWACVPCTTPASMAGLLHGDRDTVPAFRWWDREAGRLLVANRPNDAAIIETRFTPGEGLLRDGGAAISTSFSGEADVNLLVMSRATNARGLGPGGQYLPFFATFGLLPSALVLAVGEAIKEMYQGRRQRTRGVLPRVERKGAYVALRAVTNVLLRKLNLVLIAEQMNAGVPAIAVDMVDYDEIAHHAGPLRPESLRAVEGLDAILGQLQTVAKRVDRAYELVVVSDHGQSLGATFAQLSGTTLADRVDALMEVGADELLRADKGEEWGPVNTLLTSLLPGRAGQQAVLGPDRGRGAETPSELPEVVVIASGNLGMLWFPRQPERPGLDTIADRYPALVPGLLLTPGIGILVVGTAEGPTALGADGSRNLITGEVDGSDPLDGYPGRSAADLARLWTMRTSGDIVLISTVEPDGAVHAFEGLVGSHGGLGGEQNHAILLHPPGLTIDPAAREDVDGTPMLVGSWSVHEHLVRWRADIGA